MSKVNSFGSVRSWTNGSIFLINFMIGHNKRIACLMFDCSGGIWRNHIDSGEILMIIGEFRRFWRNLDDSGWNLKSRSRSFSLDFQTQIKVRHVAKLQNFKGQRCLGILESNSFQWFSSIWWMISNFDFDFGQFPNFIMGKCIFITFLIFQSVIFSVSLSLSSL